MAHWLPPETSHDEARKICDREHLRANKAPSNAQTRERPRDRAEYAEIGQQAPIQVRRDGDRFVLVHGLHRLEACKALGEETIYGYLVQAEKH